MVLHVLEPFFDYGIQNTNFFNGRLLSAEDLQVEQEANRKQHQQIGKAVGEGIVCGLEVGRPAETSSLTEDAAVVVSVQNGLALNRKGQALYLPEKINLALVREEDQVATQAGWFAPCKPPQGTAQLTGTGIYVLVLAPASGFEGSAPASFPSEKVASDIACGSRYTVEGVRFWLQELDLSTISDIHQSVHDPTTAGENAKLSKLRNHLSHLCLGTIDMQAYAINPFARTQDGSAFKKYGLLDSLSSLTDCDVPLALLYWTSGGIQFIDNWSVRRRVIAPSPDSDWLPLVGSRRFAESQAAFLQFQDQINQLILNAPSLPERASITAKSHFRFLPAAGLLPIIESASPDLVETFFNQIPHCESEYIDGSLLRHLIRASFDYPPIDLNLNESEIVWLYRIRQNKAPTEDGTETAYVVFTTGHMPHLAGEHAGRFDLAHWDYSVFV